MHGTKIVGVCKGRKGVYLRIGEGFSTLFYVSFMETIMVDSKALREVSITGGRGGFFFSSPSILSPMVARSGELDERFPLQLMIFFLFGFRFVDDRYYAPVVRA